MNEPTTRLTEEQWNALKAEKKASWEQLVKQLHQDRERLLEESRKNMEVRNG